MSEASTSIRIMVVDDSATMRAILIRILSSEYGMHIVSSASDGLEAVKKIQRDRADVILLDLEMPHMDGLTAIPKLLAVNPQAKIIIVSSHSHAKADITMKALEAGAIDFIQKPGTSGMAFDENFSKELLEKVKAWGDCALAESTKNSAPMPALKTKRIDVGDAKYTRAIINPDAPIVLRKSVVKPVEAIAFGCSTGGPQALLRVLKELKKVEYPVFVTQHMPSAFTKAFADSVTSSCGIVCHEAEHGMAVENGKIYLAPGGKHMGVSKVGSTTTIQLNEDPPENFCRPAVDVMLRSLSKAYGSGVMAVILTGMGADGLNGCEAVAAQGGIIIAQNKETSVVWGMPGVVAQAGLCHAVLPIEDIASGMIALARKGAL